MRTRGRVGLPALGCAAAFLLCELISRPWAELGVSDDWSYIYTAKVLAQTGHIVYVGWASAIVGWQFYMAAACIKLLGFSFTAARLPTLLIAALTAYLMQRTLVRFGVSEGNAVLGTLTFVLSPIYMPLAATMMSDVPGFFSVLACVYGCVRALQAEKDREAVLWLCFAVAVNAVCGTSRQICWLGVFVVVPSTLWLLRSRRSVLLQGVAATAFGIGFVLVVLHWFNVQPYALPEPVALAPFHMWAWKFVFIHYVKSVIETGLLLTPVCIPFLASTRHFSRRNFAGMAALAVISFAFVFYLGQIKEQVYGVEVIHSALRSMLVPFLGDWFGPYAMLGTISLASRPPVILSPVVVALLSFFAMACVLCVVTTIVLVRPVLLERRPSGGLSWGQIGVLFVPVTFVYCLLLSRHGVNLIFDRYLFTPMFLVLVCVLLYSQQHIRLVGRIASYIAVAAIAFYGIVSTHNLFALNRARSMLAEEIFASGVRPSEVDLGWEVNGWYELQIPSYVNSPLLVRPAGAYHPMAAGAELHGCRESNFGLFLHMAPIYGLAYEANACEGPAPFAPVSYWTWPMSRPTTLYVVRYATPRRPESDYAVPSAAAEIH